MDWTAIILAVIHEAPGIIIACGTIITAVLTFINNRKIEMVHKATNSMHEEIVTITKAEGVAIGRAQVAAEQKDSE